MNLKNKPEKNILICLMALMVVEAVYYVLRIQYGMVEIDEQFYLAIWKRFCVGDRFLLDEWNTAQFFSVLMAPILKLYLAIVPTSDGIFIAFRIMYVLCHILVGGLITLTLKDRLGYGALLVNVIYVMHTPFNLTTFSYYASGNGILVILICVILLKIKNKTADCLLKGILTAYLVCCNPYCAILYIFQLCYFIYGLIRKKNSALREVLLFHVGILIPVVIFLVMFYRFDNPVELAKDVYHNLQGIFTEAAGDTKGVLAFLNPLIDHLKEFYWYSVSLLLVFIVGCVDKKRRFLYYPAIIVISSAMAVFFMIHNDWLSGNIFPALICVVGAVSYFWNPDADGKLFRSCYLMPLGYALCVYYASNNGVTILQSCTVGASITSVIFIYEYCNNAFDTTKSTKWTSIAFLSIVIIAEIVVKCSWTHWDGAISEMNARITEGPAKGVITSQAKKDCYEAYVNDVKSINAGSEDTVLFYRNYCDGYLMTDARYGSRSPFVYEDPEYPTGKMQHYYELHPDRVPNIIYADSITIAQMGEEYWEEYGQANGYALSKCDSGAMILRK